MFHKHLLAASALAAGLVSSSFAAEGVRPIIGAGLTVGGKTLASARMSDGSTQRVSSGGLISMFGGLEYRAAPDAPFTVQATIGYHVDDTDASNGSISFSRVPVELITFWNPNAQFRFGLGLRKATNAKLSSSGAANSVPDVSMSSDLGLVLQGDYYLSPQMSTFLRLVSERYKSPLLNDNSVSGNHIGMGIAYRF